MAVGLSNTVCGMWFVFYDLELNTTLIVVFAVAICVVISDIVTCVPLVNEAQI